MTNSHTRIAREFHDRTAHSPASVRSSGHYLDWDIKPLPFKIYPDLASVSLPREFAPVSQDTLRVLAPGGWPGRAVPDAVAPEPTAPHGPPEAMTLDALALVLFLSAGLTKKKTSPGGGEIHFRAAPSTGALYQTEVYVVAGAVDGLPAGVYHFSPGDFSLRRLRAGDHRAVLEAAGADRDLARRPVTLVLSAIYWRNTWKYQARGYRHLFWDSGTMLANLLAVGSALGLGPWILTGFVDADVNRLLGLDSDQEASLELVALGPVPARPRPGHPSEEVTAGSSASAPSPTDPRGAFAGPDSPAPRPTRVEPIAFPSVPLSSSSVDYPLLREVHAASMLDTPEAVRAWRQAAPLPGRLAGGTTIALPAPRTGAGHALGDTILRRGSTRQFSHAPLAAAELSTALAVVGAGFAADFPPGLVSVYLVVNAVEGVEAGSYHYEPGPHRLELLRRGDFRARSAHLCLEQPLGGDAAAVLYFLAPLDAILARWGNRGYRIANLEAGIRGGRAYLAAYAQGFGASGLTFYDREVVGFLEPHAAGLDAVFVTALGRSTQRSRA